LTGTRHRIRDEGESSEGDERDRAGLPRLIVGLAMTSGKGFA